MSQDTRKDPRAKIVSLNVRYKSATVDEFIENHSLDVSRGGLFIKTSTPFAQGTLLKFEIRLSSDQPVIAGVGRVVWKREPGQAATDRPAGMGVKFIKIDDRSRALIERLVTTKAGAGTAFTQQQQDDEVTAIRPSVPDRLELPSLKPTVSGMPALSATGEVIEGPAIDAMTTPMMAITGSTSTSVVTTMVSNSSSSSGSSGGAFFPTTNSEADMPPPQERTMMRQAAELLEEALKASGGSMEEVEQNPLFAGMAPSAAANFQPAAEPPRGEPREEQVATIGGFPTSSPSAAPAVVTPAAMALAAAEANESAPMRRSSPPADRRPGSTPPPRSAESSRPSMSSRPVRATDLIADSASKKSGGGGILWAGVAVLAIGGGLAYAYQAGMLTEATKPPPVATPTPTASTTQVAQTAPPTATSAAPPTTSASAPAIEPTASAKTPEPVAAKTPEPPPVAKAPEPVAVKAPPVKRPAPAPAKPVEAKTEEKPTETVAEPKPTEPKPTESKTPASETKPDGETTPTPPAKKPPAKAPAKPKEDSDNPY